MPKRPWERSSPPSPPPPKTSPRGDRIPGQHLGPPPRPSHDDRSRRDGRHRGGPGPEGGSNQSPAATGPQRTGVNAIERQVFQYTIDLNKKRPRRRQPDRDEKKAPIKTTAREQLRKPAPSKTPEEIAAAEEKRQVARREYEQARNRNTGAQGVQLALRPRAAAEGQGTRQVPGLLQASYPRQDPVHHLRREPPAVLQAQLRQAKFHA